MYGYYFLSSLGPQMQPYLWWKRYLTQMQIVQFVIGGLYGIYFVMYQENYPPFIVANYIIQAILYLFLFTKFYLNTYNKKAAKSFVDQNGNYENQKIKVK